MPEKYTVKITQQAQEQIREIVSYIRFTLQAPETALLCGPGRVCQNISRLESWCRWSLRP